MNQEGWSGSVLRLPGPLVSSIIQVTCTDIVQIHFFYRFPSLAFRCVISIVLVVGFRSVIEVVGVQSVFAHKWHSICAQGAFPQTRRNIISHFVSY